MLSRGECILYYKKMIIALDAGKYDQVLNIMAELKDNLDCRFLALERENEFLRYCQKLLENKEYPELGRLIKGKVNERVNPVVNNANILELNTQKIM